MRKNEYGLLKDFVNEYKMKHEKGETFYIGIDFTYNDNDYRVCLEPIGAYYIYKVVESKKRNAMPSYQTLGICNTMEDLLNSTFIDNKKFSVVIMEDNTIINGKD